uniref:ADP-ribosylation factor-like 6 interacting protein 1 n=1 Tax=Eptatretus burgeri TaxID=7764 RepID=A0A8C4R1Z8_EPTBU
GSLVLTCSELVYWLDPSILTGLSTLVMFVCLADYMVPIVTERFFGPDMYLHEQQQQRFHEICSQLVQSKHATRAVFDSLCTLRQERPRMYYITVLLLLALVAWIGHQIHNLLLTYLLVVFGLMLPGLNQHGFVSKYSSMVWQEIDKLAKRKEKSQ